MDWLGTSWSTVGIIAACGVGTYVAVLGLTRIMGARSFSQLSTFDFAVTLAVASVFAATTVNSSVSLAEGVVALVVLYGLQMAVAAARRRGLVARLVDNPPILVWDTSGPIEANMRAAHVTMGDVREAMRGADVAAMSDVRGVVMESTGHLTVLTAADPGPDDPLFADVRLRPDGAPGTPARTGRSGPTDS